MRGYRFMEAEEEEGVTCREQAQQIVVVLSEAGQLIEKVVGSVPAKAGEASEPSGTLADLTITLEVIEGQARYLVQKLNELVDRL